MLTIIMATSKIGSKLLFGDTSGKLPWGQVKQDMEHFKCITEVAKGRIFACSKSTYSTLPVKARKRLQPMVVAEDYDRLIDMLSTTDIQLCEVVVLGGRKLIDSCIPHADHIMISEIGNVEHKDSFIYLREETVAKLAEFERVSSCWPFATGVAKVEEGVPYLRQAYCLSRD
jgi:dihydrofolate reductase